MKKRYYFIILIIVIAILSWGRVESLCRVITLFDKDKIVWNFQNMDRLVDVKYIDRAEEEFEFEYELEELIEYIEVDNKSLDVRKYLEETKTSAFIILKGNRVIYEEYFGNHNKDSRLIGWSLSKALISALIGIAHEEGFIPDLHARVEEYLPEFIGTGYEGVRIVDLLEMSSGIKFDEYHSKFFSDINKFSRSFALGRSMDKYLLTLKRRNLPGIKHRYVSLNTQVLAMILAKGTGQDLTSYTYEKLWSRIGTGDRAYWLVDNKGRELAFGGFAATARDYAKLAYLYLNNGVIVNDYIISEEWIAKSTRSDKAHLQWSTINQEGKYSFGYGYHWWIPQYPQEGEFFALGAYNQCIYINQSLDMAIIKLSANWRFKEGARESNKEMIAFIRELAKGFNQVY